MIDIMMDENQCQQYKADLTEKKPTDMIPYQ